MAAPAESDLHFLRRTFELAATSVTKGERPFAASIVDGTRKVIVETENICRSSGDVTAHAEVTAIRKLPAGISRETLAACTLYASAEPCAMCAGAIYWANVGRVVFGLGEERLRNLRNVDGNAFALTMSCREVLATGGHQTEVLGPVLEDEAVEAHLAFWDDDATRKQR